MTQPRSTSSPADALGATIANQSARSSALEQVAHRHPAFMGRGVVAALQQSVGSDITGITTTITDIPALSVQFIADPTRLYRVTLVANMRSSVADDGMRMYLSTDTGVVLRSATVSSGTGSTLITNHLEHLMTGNGLVKLKAQVARIAGSGSIDVFRSQTQWVPYIVVEDIAGLPSPFVIAGNASIDTITDIGGTLYRVITFATGTGELQVLNGDISSLEYLIVGGGGGGGNSTGFTEGAGGGGAGGLLTNIGSPIAVTSGSYSVIVGAGAVGVSGYNVTTAGGDSSLLGVTAFGGGFGGRGGTGGSGASGGGGGGDSAVRLGGTGIAGQGNNGGQSSVGVSDATRAGGGGGGAGAVGGNASSGQGGNGGNGVSNTITGSSVTYAGGGGGISAAGVAGTGGSGGGANGGANSGVNGTGGGGGGVTSGTSGSGGSGVVIVRFPYTPTSFQQ